MPDAFRIGPVLNTGIEQNLYVSPQGQMTADRLEFSTPEISGLFSNPCRIKFYVRFDKSERGVVIIVLLMNRT